METQPRLLRLLLYSGVLKQDTQLCAIEASEDSAGAEAEYAERRRNGGLGKRDTKRERARGWWDGIGVYGDGPTPPHRTQHRQVPRHPR